MTLVVRLLAAGLAALAVGGTVATSVPAATSLNDAERATLLSMREEEKLAHDVYVALAARWGDRVFGVIAGAETRHERAIETALTAYGIVDPTDGLGVGKFATARFQQLYDALTAKGAASRLAALGVGVWIEQTDTADLRAAIGQTDEPMLDRIYGNLLAASTSHLAAFERVVAAPASQALGPNGGAPGPRPGR